MAVVSMPSSPNDVSSVPSAANFTVTKSSAASPEDRSTATAPPSGWMAKSFTASTRPGRNGAAMPPLPHVGSSGGGAVTAPAGGDVQQGQRREQGEGARGQRTMTHGKGLSTVDRRRATARPIHRFPPAATEPEVPYWSPYCRRL